MKMFQKAMVLGVVLMMGAGAAQAESSNPDIKARQDLMKVIGMNTKVLGDMAGGKAAYDATAAAAAKVALAAAAMEIPVKFETNVDDADSEVKATIWTDWTGYLAKAKMLEDAANAIDVSSVETIGAGMAGIGGSCKACHTDYRAKK